MPRRLSGIPRRDFLSLCSSVAAMLGLGPGGVRKVQAALAAGLRQPILWLHFAECTGCTESLLRSTSPYFDDLILNTLSLDYHETLMVEAGSGAETLRANLLAKYAGDFVCVVEGSIPTAANGAFGTIGAQTMYGIAAEVLPKARAIIAIGSCSSDGGVAAASPNPAGVRGIGDAFPGLKVPVIKCPGCPPNPVNFVAIIADYLLKGTAPTLDSSGRPTFAYGKTVHQQCGLLGTSRCLQSRGCRGIATFHNCPQVKFNDKTSYCQQAGHVCIACSEAGFWDSGAFWNASFWNGYDVKVDPGKPGITYSGNPNGIVSTNVGPADAGVGGASGGGGSSDAGRPSSSGGTSGTGGASASGGTSGTGGTSASAGTGGTGGTSASGGASGTTSSGGTTASGSGGAVTSGGTTSAGGTSVASSGGAAGSGGTSVGGADGSVSDSRAGCACEVGSPALGSLPLVGTLGALVALADRWLHPPSADSPKGEPCPESSSTPLPASKDI